jgi:hypothetical protein
MGAGTPGEGNHNMVNSCGVAKSHAYTIVGTFMLDGEKMIMMRNPWGSTRYTGPWSRTDSRWNSARVAQVPFGIDPRVDHSIGIFTIPLATFADKTSDCISDYVIGHMRDGEGYNNYWYDEDSGNMPRKSWSSSFGLNGGTDETE